MPDQEAVIVELAHRNINVYLRHGMTLIGSFARSDDALVEECADTLSDAGFTVAAGRVRGFKYRQPKRAVVPMPSTEPMPARRKRPLPTGTL